MSTTISRRTFITGATAAGVALAAGSYFTWNRQNIPNSVKIGDVTYGIPSREPRHQDHPSRCEGRGKGGRIT